MVRFIWNALSMKTGHCMSVVQGRDSVHLKRSDNMMMTSNGNIFRVAGPFVSGIRQSPVDFPHKGQWRGALKLSLICAWINDWVNNRDTGDLRRYRSPDDVTVRNWERNRMVVNRQSLLASGTVSSTTRGVTKCAQKGTCVHIEVQILHVITWLLVVWLLARKDFHQLRHLVIEKWQEMKI